MKNWKTINSDDGMHIIPLEDLKPHKTTAICFCRPREEGIIFIHKLFDGREITEKAISYVARIELRN